MEISRIGSQPSNKGPADWFTGTVRIDPLFQANARGRAAGASVTFEPGARTAWHTHPLGQTLIVTAGCGRVQREGGPVEEIRPGDVVWIPPGVKHWHGAAPTTAMTHVAIQEKARRQGRGLAGTGEGQAIRGLMLWGRAAREFKARFCSMLRLALEALHGGEVQRPGQGRAAPALAYRTQFDAASRVPTRRPQDIGLAPGTVA